MEAFLKNLKLDITKFNINQVSNLNSSYLLQRKVLIPFSTLAVVYFVFIKRVGFGNTTVTMKKRVKKDEEFDGEEEPPIEKKSIAISGWLFTRIYSLLSTSLFGKVIMNAIKSKFKVTMLRNMKICESPTFHPLVRGDNELYKQQAITEEKLWEITKASCPNSDGFHFNSISELITLYDTKKLTPIDVAQCVINSLRECEKQNPSLKAFIEYYENIIMEQAFASTVRWKEGKPLSIIDGIPVGVKDEFLVAGHHCRNGLPIADLNQTISAGEEKGLVKRLRNGGAMIIGITNMHQIGIGVYGINQSKHHGTSRNPYNVEHSTGGSSGGSAAAVASGLCTIGLGTDGGGSIRLPAAVCGVVGLKATYARYSCAGMMSNAATVTHSGPLCSNVKDAALCYGFLAGKDEDYELGYSQPPVYLGDFSNTAISGFKIGVDWQWMDACDPDINSKCIDLLKWLEKECNVEIVSIHIPEKECIVAYYPSNTTELSLSVIRLLYAGAFQLNTLSWNILELYIAHSVTILSEMGSTNRRLFDEHFDELNVDVQSALVAARSSDAHDYLQAARQRTRSMNALKYIFKKVDAIFTPGFTTFQPEITSSIENYGYANYGLTLSLLRYHALGNLTGIPGMCQPIGYAENNLPVSIQLMASWWREDILFRIAYIIEKHVKIRKPGVYFDILE